MSYILDALKKAAEQRSGPPPEVRRLLSPAPVTAASPSRYVTLAVAAAGVVAAAAVVWMWPAAHDVPAPAATPVASVIIPTQSEKPPVPALEAKSIASLTPAVQPRALATKPRIAETKPSRTTPLGATSAPSIVAVLPPAATPAAPRTDIARLKVEVIVYSDLRPQRWAFINGRKYVEGDVIGDGGARVEEIQSTGVVIAEDGRRTTLRP